jgi:serine/threonine-protein kinase
VQPGDRLGGWIIDSRVGGAGAWGVFRAHATDPEGGLAVVKVVPRLDAGRQARFEAQTSALSQLAHPGLARVRDAGHDPARDALWAALERVDGVSVERLLRAGPLDPPDAARLVADAAEALAAAHAAGVLHGDIKPANLVRRADGTTALLGFDLAGPDPDGPSDDAAPLLAPEAREPTADPVLADVYALGALLCVALGGTLDPGAEHQDPGALLPAPLRAVVQRATMRSPSRRFPDLGAMAARLRELRLASTSARAPVGPRELPSTVWVQRGGDLDPRPLQPLPERAGPALPELVTSEFVIDTPLTPPPAPEAAPPPARGGLLLAVAAVGVLLAGVLAATVVVVAVAAALVLRGATPGATPSPTDPSLDATPEAPLEAPADVDPDTAAPPPLPPAGAPSPRPSPAPRPTTAPSPTPSPSPSPSIAPAPPPAPAPAAPPPVNARGEVLLVIETSPPGAEVSVGGEIVGTSPVQVYVSPGDKRVRLRHDSAGRDSETLRVAESSRRFCYRFAADAWTAGPCR